MDPGRIGYEDDIADNSIKLSSHCSGEFKQSTKALTKDGPSCTNKKGIINTFLLTFQSDRKWIISNSYVSLYV